MGASGATKISICLIGYRDEGSRDGCARQWDRVCGSGGVVISSVDCGDLEELKRFDSLISHATKEGGGKTS